MKIVNTVVIVGGGSSAWLTAAYLSNNCDAEVVVIDKEHGQPIGVGEATLLTFRPFMEDCGFDFSEWFTETEATFKSGILFSNWVDKGNIIWHPFYTNPHFNNTNLHSCWSKVQKKYKFKDNALAMYDVSVNKNKIDTSLFDSYGFHVNAGKLVEYLQNKLKNKIRFIQSEVVNSYKDNNNNIFSLTLANGHEIRGDLFIDCTGFRSVLNPNNKKESLQGRLFTNTAIAGPIPYQNKDTEMSPYTKSIAVDHGWIWITPTQTRMGSGLVFNKDITSVEEAKDYFVKFWNNRIDKDQLRVINWTPYHTKTPWQNNCVSVGLSSGFIEPIESTGLAMIEWAATYIKNIIQSKSFTDADIDHYNQQYSDMFENCVDFVSLHYSKTNRTEKFWNFVKENFIKTKGLEKYLELLEKQPLYTKHRKTNQIFSGANWCVWAAQLGYQIGEDPIEIPVDIAEKLMLKYIETVEKYRYNHSHHHSTEVERMIKVKNYE